MSWHLVVLSHQQEQLYLYIIYVYSAIKSDMFSVKFLWASMIWCDLCCSGEIIQNGRDRKIPRHYTLRRFGWYYQRLDCSISIPALQFRSAERSCESSSAFERVWRKTFSQHCTFWWPPIIKCLNICQHSMRNVYWMDAWTKVMKIYIDG